MQSDFHQTHQIDWCAAGAAAALVVRRRSIGAHKQEPGKWKTANVNIYLGYYEAVQNA